MMFGLQKIDLLVIFVIVSGKFFFIGFVPSMVITIFPTLIELKFNESSLVSYFRDSENWNNETTRNSSFSYLQLSLLYSMKYGPQVPFSLFVGHFNTVFGSLNVALLGMGCQIITVLLYALGDQYAIIMIGRVTDGLSCTIINCSISSFIASRYHDHKQQGFMSGLCLISLTCGVILSPVVGGILFQTRGKLFTFLSMLPIMLLTIMLGTVLLVLLKRPKPPGKELDKDLGNIENSVLFNDKIEEKFLNSSCCEVKEGEKTEKIHEKIKSRKTGKAIIGFLRDPYFMILLLFMVFKNLPIFLYMAVLPRYMRERFKSTASEQGSVWILSLFGYIPGFTVGNVINAKCTKYRIYILIATMCLQSVGLLSTSFISVWWHIAFPITLFFTFFTIGYIITVPILVAITVKNHQRNVEIMSGVIWSVTACAGLLGSLVGPILLSSLGFYYLNSIIMSLGILYSPFLLFVRKSLK